MEEKASKYRSTGIGYEDRTYGATHKQLYLDQRNEELARIINEALPDSGSILEVGCGTGLVLEFLKRRFPNHQLQGVDASATMLEQAREKGMSVSSASADKLPFPDQSFDVVIATRFIHLFQHDEKKQIYEEFLRVLRPNGLAVVEFYSRPFAWLRFQFLRNRGRDEFFSHYPTMQEVRDIVGGKFRRRPVRMALSKLLVKVLGRRGLSAVTRFGFPGFLVDEYFVVTKKPN
jgi:SAM-dependent methyltransferase